MTIEKNYEELSNELAIMTLENAELKEGINLLLRRIKGYQQRIENLERKLYYRNESYRGRVFDKDPMKGHYR